MTGFKAFVPTVSPSLTVISDKSCILIRSIFNKTAVFLRVSFPFGFINCLNKHLGEKFHFSLYMKSLFDWLRIPSILFNLCV